MPETAIKESVTKSWHYLDRSKVVNDLDTHIENGLDPAEAASRQQKFGPNELVVKAGKPAWLKFILQFNQPLLIILLSAGLIKAVIGELLNASIIWGVTTINATISFIQEAGAEKKNRSPRPSSHHRSYSNSGRQKVKNSLQRTRCRRLSNPHFR
ncbi:MAG: hypothetical protein HC942_03680 [Microcoleus sp. SU_5_6]|nr:hypothetical protein [Microcoleus sp. SU_5_6]